MIEGVQEFLSKVIEIITHVMTVIATTADNINSIQFSGSLIADYFGYFAYICGTTLYALYTTVLLISIGVALWVYVLKGIAMLKELLPW